MRQYNVLQDGYKAVFDYLESNEQSVDSKYRYERAFIDISKYYETLQASSYSPVINAEYRDDRSFVSDEQYYNDSQHNEAHCCCHNIFSSFSNFFFNSSGLRH